jgi:hypothetical protein
MSLAFDDAGPCMGIEINIWERAKVLYFILFVIIIAIKSYYINYFHYSFSSTVFNGMYLTCLYITA